MRWFIYQSTNRQSMLHAIYYKYSIMKFGLNIFYFNMIAQIEDNVHSFNRKKS